MSGIEWQFGQPARAPGGSSSTIGAEATLEAEAAALPDPQPAAMTLVEQTLTDLLEQNRQILDRARREWAGAQAVLLVWWSESHRRP